MGAPVVWDLILSATIVDRWSLQLNVRSELREGPGTLHIHKMLTVGSKMGTGYDSESIILYVVVVITCRNYWGLRTGC
jgi:hypothetical protein